MGKNFARPNATKRSIPNVFNKNQLLALFENIKDTEVFMGCIIALFCGLRISEVCNLKKQDVDMDEEKLIVRQGKGSKDRVVMMPSPLIILIKRWFNATKENEYFIANECNQRYSSAILSRKFKMALDDAKLKIPTFKSTVGQQRYAYSFHTLRHTYATYLLEKGVDLYYVQRSLGHVDIHTTQIYAYISNKDLQNKINEAFGTKKAISPLKQSKNASNPLQILKMKFAEGELTREEFEEKYELLTSLEMG
jgi:integrase/recombinase XerD